MFRSELRTFWVLVPSAASWATTTIRVVPPRSMSRTPIGSSATPTASTVRITVEMWNRRDRISSRYSRRATCLVFGNAGSWRRGAPGAAVMRHPRSCGVLGGSGLGRARREAGLLICRPAHVVDEDLLERRLGDLEVADPRTGGDRGGEDRVGLDPLVELDLRPVDPRPEDPRARHAR